MFPEVGRKLVRLPLLGGIIAGNLCFAYSGPKLELTTKHSAVGRAMDTAYHDAGIRNDMAAFDLRELKRQGTSVDQKLLDGIANADREMRSRWLELNRRRAALYTEIRSLPPEGKHILRIQSLEHGPASDVGWFGLRVARFVWPDGITVQIPLKSFQNGVHRSRYDYLCAPSPAVFVYGRQSFQNTMAAGFDVEPMPKGDARLIISGLDCDKPGVTRIWIEVNRKGVFENENPFRKRGWSEHAFVVPAGVFQTEATTGTEREKIVGELKALSSDVARFKQWAEDLADRIERLTHRLRAGLVYQALDYPRNWWKTGFLRGVCFQSDTGTERIYRRGRTPWHYDNYKYVARAFRDAGVTMVYSYLREDVRHRFIDEIDKLGIPYVQCGWGWGPAGDRAPVGNALGRKEDWWTIRDTKYYADRMKFMADTKVFFRTVSKGHSCVRGLAIDEPTIRDDRADRDVTQYPSVLQAFARHLEQSRSRLEHASISLTRTDRPVTKVESDVDQAPWLEWQLFKKRFMADHYLWHWRKCDQLGIFVFPIIMTWNGSQPQGCSYVSMGELPIMSTDLYRNGTVIEGFLMQLLHNAARGKAIMTTGSGYSCKSPDRFRRSLATSMVHADGVLQWEYAYCSKYRNAGYFWRMDGKRMNHDDRGREMLSNWRPEYWDIQVDMFRKMRAAEDLLVGTRSEGNVVLLHSERTDIADSAHRSQGYFNGNLGLYSDLLQRARPMDACFVESMSSARMKRYSVAILADARVMTTTEADTIRDWVKSGGTLIASANTSLCDEWGREQEDFALADIFGAHYVETTKGASTFTAKGITVEYYRNQPYAVVKPDGDARVAAKWDTGDPALVLNRAGKGRVWFLTARKPGARMGRQESQSALRGKSCRGMGELLRRIVDRCAGQNSVTPLNAPKGLEVQVRRKGEAIVVHLLDWFDERKVDGLKLKLNVPGRWTLSEPFTGLQTSRVDRTKPIPVRPFHLYHMIVLQPTR